MTGEERGDGQGNTVERDEMTPQVHCDMCCIAMCGVVLRCTVICVVLPYVVWYSGARGVVFPLLVQW